MLGQYRGPVEVIRPEKMGARSRFARIRSWTAGVVRVSQQEMPSNGPSAASKANLESAQAEAEALQACREGARGRFAETSARPGLLAAVQQTAQEGARGQHDGPSGKGPAALAPDAGHLVAVDEDFGHRFLEAPQVRLPADDLLHGLGVGAAVALGPGALDGWPLAAVQEPVLDGGPVGGAGHLAAEGVDLADHLALGLPADGRVARHLGDSVETDGDERGPGAEPCGRQGGLASGVSAADDHDVERFVRHVLAFRTAPHGAL